MIILCRRISLEIYVINVSENRVDSSNIYLNKNFYILQM